MSFRKLDVIVAFITNNAFGYPADIHGRTFRRQVKRFGVAAMADAADSWGVPRFPWYR